MVVQEGSPSPLTILSDIKSKIHLTMKNQILEGTTLLQNVLSIGGTFLFVLGLIYYAIGNFGVSHAEQPPLDWPTPEEAIAPTTAPSAEEQARKIIDNNEEFMLENPLITEDGKWKRPVETEGCTKAFLSKALTEIALLNAVSPDPWGQYNLYRGKVVEQCSEELALMLDLVFLEAYSNPATNFQASPTLVAQALLRARTAIEGGAMTAENASDIMEYVQIFFVGRERLYAPEDADPLQPSIQDEMHNLMDAVAQRVIEMCKDGTLKNIIPLYRNYLHEQLFDLYEQSQLLYAKEAKEKLKEAILELEKLMDARTETSR